MHTLAPFPDVKNCLTRHHEGSLWACLVDTPEECPFLFRLNRMYCCRHENRSDFAESTVVKQLISFNDQHLCHTKHFVGAHYECMVEKPTLCPHALSFGFSYFCRHESRADFSDSDGLPGL